MAAIDPLTAGAVLLATAATDAVYVMFTSAVVARKRVPAATWSSVWYLLSSYAVISYTENWVYVAFAAVGSWLGAYASITLSAPPARRPAGGSIAGVVTNSVVIPGFIGSNSCAGTVVSRLDRVRSTYVASVSKFNPFILCGVRWIHPPSLVAQIGAQGAAIATTECETCARSRGVICPELCIFVCSLEDQRAQGRPGARCTRGLVCDVCKQGSAHTSIQVQRRTSGLPCAMALRLIRGRPGDRLCLSPSPCEALASSRLDTSNGVPGPHDFTVRNGRARLRCRHVHRSPTLRSDDHDAPLLWAGMAGVIRVICPTG